MPATKKSKLKQLHTKVIKLLAIAEGDGHMLVVRRGGTAQTREVFAANKIRLSWTASGDSVPIPVPSGQLTLHCFARGDSGDTWGFTMNSPHVELLGGGQLGPLGAEAFDRTVNIP